MTTLTTGPVLRKPALPRESRVAPRPKPKLLREWTVGDCTFTLSEEEGCDFPYYLTIGYEGLPDRRQGFDSVRDARAYAFHCTEPHKLEHTAKNAVPLRRTVVKPVPEDPEVEPFEVRRVRTGHTYCLWQDHEYSWDAAEARSGLVGHKP